MIMPSMDMLSPNSMTAMAELELPEPGTKNSEIDATKPTPTSTLPPASLRKLSSLITGSSCYPEADDMGALLAAFCTCAANQG